MCWRNLCALRVSWGSLQTCEEISADCGVTPKHWIRLRSTLNEGYGMDLTVSDLAIAVSKSEEYVRRRIRQDYLSARREGRRLYVTQLEAARWARESGLHFVSRVSHPQPMGKLQCRTARMTVLAWHPKSRAPVNLFTHVRHRSRDSLGPWAGDPDESWSCVIVSTTDGDEPGELRLHRLDAPFEHCQRIVDSIRSASVLRIDDLEITYSLEHSPRHYWAYRDLRSDAEVAVLSPFPRHSAEVVEFWSFNEELRQRWQELLKSSRTNLESLMEGQNFRLDRRPERVGNLMIAGAEDETVCDLWKHRGNSLLLKVDRADGEELPIGAYTALVWANHSDDNVVRREIAVVANETVVELPSEVDHIGFAIHRTSDGHCIDLMDVHLLMGVGISMHIDAGPNLTMHDSRRSTTNQVSLGSRRSMINVDADEYRDLRDRTIRRWVLDRRAFERDAEARHARNLARFGPGQMDEAVDYFLHLLRQHTYSEEAIYLADPYFMARGSGGSADRLYVGIFETTMGRPLRILCGQRVGAAWWSNYPSALIGHATVRLFTKNDDPLFHDRYLITSEQEILISNSISGWESDGVTFAALPYGVYREEAEALWEIPIGKHRDDSNVCEVK